MSDMVELLARLLWATAGICLILSAYFVWRVERKKVIELEEKIRPKLKCAFSKKDPGCVKSTTLTKRSTRNYAPSQFTLAVGSGTSMSATSVFHGTLNNKPTMEADYYRLRVETDNVDRVSNCRGRLLSIKDGDISILEGEPIDLPFAMAERADAINKQINSGAPEYLDLFYITEDNRVELAIHRFEGPSSVNWKHLFIGSGNYTFDIVILSDSPPIPFKCTLKWDWKRETAEVTCP